MLATTVNGQLSRYQVTKSALLFLAENCKKFRGEIGSNSYLWFSYMKFCCTSENKTVSPSYSSILVRIYSNLFQLMCFDICVFDTRRSKSTRLRAQMAF